MKKQIFLYLQFLNNNKDQVLQVIPAFIEIICPVLTDSINFCFLKYKCTRWTEVWRDEVPGGNAGEVGHQEGVQDVPVLCSVSSKPKVLYAAHGSCCGLPNPPCCLLLSPLQLGPHWDNSLALPSAMENSKHQVKAAACKAICWRGKQCASASTLSGLCWPTTHTATLSKCRGTPIQSCSVSA